MPLTARVNTLRWDSSDPDRAPPPLPLNPGSPSVTTRPNTSATIAAAAQALQEKARESAPASAYTTNPMPSKSPERSLIKGAHHKRLQSLQSGSVRDLRSYLDGSKSPDRSPERTPNARASSPASPTKDAAKEQNGAYSPEKTPSRLETPTPASRDVSKERPSLRPSSRATHRSILGENTPPSATMLALQKMSARDYEFPLTQPPMGSPSPTKEHQGSDQLSSQMSLLTNMMSSVQREMAQLSRRSKDNATDLISLKEATNTRDEDIRKSLRDLVNNIPNPFAAAFTTESQSASNIGMSFLESPAPAHGGGGAATASSPKKAFSLPRIPSPNSFLMDDRVGSPSPYSVEGAASVAMLEKIIREMVTKEGQERLLSTLNQLFDRANEESGETKKKVAELVDFIKDGSQSQALVAQAVVGHARGIGGGADGLPRLDLHFNGSQLKSVARADGDVGAGTSNPTGANSSKPYTSPKAADFVSDQMLSLLKKIKDSVTESGGLTNDTKRLIRDFRSEALGLGREIGEKVDQLNQSLANQEGRSKEELEFEVRDDIVRVVREGLDELKQHMERIVREKRRQSGSSIISRSTVDNNEVYGAVKHVLAQHGLDRSLAPHQAPVLDKDAILSAVREAYESYRPEVEVQQFGLERDEILQCLREGLEDYRCNPTAGDGSSVSREEVMDAINQAMQHFHPPAPVNEMQELRDEVLNAVRECLEDFKPSVAAGPREIEINRNDLLDAVKTGLECSRGEIGGYGPQVLDQLHDLLQDMRAEFKSYSAANGRDTEQVLDAMKDGLESLRIEVEAYVSRAQDVTGKEEIIDTVRHGLEQLRGDVQGFVSGDVQGDGRMNRGDILTYIKTEFDHLHETIGEGGALKEKEEILTALQDGFDSLRSQTILKGTESELSGEMQGMMREEFVALKEAVLNGSAAHKEEILESIQLGFDDAQSRLGMGSVVSSSGSSEEVIAVMKEELGHLRETIASTLIRSASTSDKDDMIDAVRESLQELRTHLASGQSETLKETLGTLQSDVEQLRQEFASRSMSSADSANSDLLESLRSTVEDIRETAPQGGISHEILEAIQGEFERVRHSVAGASRSKADTDDILDAIRLGLDDLRSHLDKKLDVNPDKAMSASNEVLDALNDGLDNLRVEVVKIVDKPVDMTVTYEILETLKDGLANVRDDLEHLKKGRRKSTITSEPGHQVVLAESTDGPLAREVPEVSVPKDTLQKNDLEKMEVMLAQLQIKVEALDANMQDAAAREPAAAASSDATAGSAMKTDLDSIEVLIRDLQADIAALATREREADGVLATKEDVEAIENLLRNTKATLDDAAFPDPETIATKEQLDSVETVVRMTSDAIDGLAGKITDSTATKGDIAAMEVLMHEMKTAVDDINISHGSDDSTLSERLTKSDVDVVGVLCTEIKDKISELTIPDADSLPSKADVEQLTGLINDFRETYDRFKDSYETDIGITAKAFDDRKKEAEMMAENIVELKVVLGEVKDEIKSTLDQGGDGIHTLEEIVKGLEETIATKFNVTTDVKELMDTVTQEFERSAGALDSLKADHDQHSSTALQKHNDVKEAIVAEMAQKLEEHFLTIMAKYDDAQLATDLLTKTMDEKTVQQEEMLNSTREMAEDLKITVDTLGTSVTTLQSTFAESTEKIGEDSKTVFARMDETFGKIDEHHAENVNEHQQTRGDIATAMETLNGLQGDVSEFNPKFMVTLHEILALVNQHYQQSQKAQETMQAQARSSEESRTHIEEIKNSFSNLPALLPAPAGAPPTPPIFPPAEKYDDSSVHEKLDTLMGRLTESEPSVAQLARLDEIHQQVVATANDVSQFVAAQTTRITNEHETKEKEAEEVALVLERRLAQKEQVESDITNLNDEKERLRTAVETLRAEQEALSARKAILATDVASLETALDIRHEELGAMDAKADALERRIMEGIMNHSRAVLLTKAAAPKASRNVPIVPFQRTTSSASQHASTSMPPPTASASSMNPAVKTRGPQGRRGLASGNPAGRRILSLNQITGNVPTGAQAFSSLPSNPGVPGGGMKRSHSVKTPHPRKVSWGRPPAIDAALPESNKENESVIEEGESELADNTIADPSEAVRTPDEFEGASDTGTERRHSSGTAAATESGMTYLSGPSTGYPDSVTDDGVDRRTSYTGTESGLTYASGSYASGSSYMTGSDLDRRTSFGSTVRSNLGADIAIEEESEDDDDDDVEVDEEQSEEVGQATPRHASSSAAGLEQSVSEAAPAKRDIVLFNAPSDSGLGTDIPTGMMSGGETDYFRRAAEWKA